MFNKLITKFQLFEADRPLSIMHFSSSTVQISYYRIVTLFVTHRHLIKCYFILLSFEIFETKKYLINLISAEFFTRACVLDHLF